MTFKVFILGFLFSALVLADQITLKNGDRITGSVVKKDGDKLTIKTDLMGEVTVPWNSITSFSSAEPLTVVLPSGAQVNGKVNIEGNDLQVQGPAKTESAPVAQVPAIRNAVEQAKYERLLHPGWLDLWTGYADLGYALARGNAKTSTLTTGFNAVRATNNDKTTAFFNQILSSATIRGVNAQTANLARGGLSYDHNISSRLFYNVSGTGEYDNFQGLDFRGVIGAGLGFHAIKTDRTILDFLVGGDYAHEAYANGDVRNLAEINGGDDFSYKISGVSSLVQSFRIYYAPGQFSDRPLLTDRAQYRMNFNLGVSTQLYKWLSWQVTAADKFLNVPPPGAIRNDIILSTGVRATFARQ